MRGRTKSRGFLFPNDNKGLGAAGLNTASESEFRFWTWRHIHIVYIWHLIGLMFIHVDNMTSCLFESITCFTLWHYYYMTSLMIMIPITDNGLLSSNLVKNVSMIYLFYTMLWGYYSVDWLVNRFYCFIACDCWKGQSNCLALV